MTDYWYRIEYGIGPDAQTHLAEGANSMAEAVDIAMDVARNIAKIKLVHHVFVSSKGRRDWGRDRWKG